MKAMNKDGGTPGVFVPIERESPKGRQHLHTMEAGAWLPFMQSSLTGLIVGVVCLVLAFSWRWENPWSWGLIPGVLTWGFTWLALQRHWFSLTKLEEVTKIDINGDGVIGENPQPTVLPEDNPRVIRVHLDEVKNNGHWQQRRFDIHATEEQLRLLAEGLLERERPFSLREWCGSDRPFSVEQFSKLRTEMVQNELLAMVSEKDPRQGFALTKAGQAFLTEFLPR